MQTIFLIFLLCISSHLYAATPTEKELLDNGLPKGLPLDEDFNEKDFAGWAIYLDNDLLVPGAGRDQDYTGGLGLVLAGKSVTSNWISLDKPLNYIDSLLGVDSLHGDNEIYQLHSQQIGLQIFTPDNSNGLPLTDTRPYANLLSISNSQRTVTSPLKPVYQSTFTVGLLGTSLGETVQNGIHKLTGSEIESGWDDQISEGGELTFQYTFSLQELLSSNFQEEDLEYEIKYSTEYSVGYITEANISLSGRWGIINTPWWSYSPEAGNYMMLTTPVVGNSVRSNVEEFYLLYGLKLKARVYNVFLQGQFRESPLTIDSNQLRPILGEAWLGFTKQFNNYRFSYILRYETDELKSEFGGDNQLWAGIQFSADF